LENKSDSLCSTSFHHTRLLTPIYVDIDSLSPTCVSVCVSERDLYAYSRVEQPLGCSKTFKEERGVRGRHEFYSAAWKRWNNCRAWLEK